MNGTLDINRDAVHKLGGACVHIGADLLRPGARAVDDEYIPNLDLECRSAWSICRGVWSETFTRMAADVTSVGGKLQTCANLVGATDQALVDEFRPVAGGEPSSIPGREGRQYR